MPAVIRFQVSRGDADCALVALSIALQRSYEDVIAAAARVTRSDRPHNRGFVVREIKAIARRLGFTLRLRRAFDVDDDEGIVGFVTDDPQAAGHVAYVKRGLVWDVDGTVWEIETYSEATGYRPVSLLEVATL